jgi:hypothetical protein
VLSLKLFEPSPDKRYYLIISENRFTPNQLEGIPPGIVKVLPLRPIQRKGKDLIELVLDRETALRSYVVWYYEGIFEGDVHIYDGDGTRTYDIPAFVEACVVPANRFGWHESPRAAWTAWLKRLVARIREMTGR